MDFYIAIAVPNIDGWNIKKIECANKAILEQYGIEPLCFSWNKHITLTNTKLNLPMKNLVSKEDDCNQWVSFVLSGDFYLKIEDDVNDWIDDEDIEYTELLELLIHIFDSQERAIFVFERECEDIDSIYEDKDAEWIHNKIRHEAKRGKPLEGFATYKGLKGKFSIDDLYKCDISRTVTFKTKV